MSNEQFIAQDLKTEEAVAAEIEMSQISVDADYIYWDRLKQNKGNLCVDQLIQNWLRSIKAILLNGTIPNIEEIVNVIQKNIQNNQPFEKFYIKREFRPPLPLDLDASTIDNILKTSNEESYSKLEYIERISQKESTLLGNTLISFDKQGVYIQLDQQAYVPKQNVEPKSITRFQFPLLSWIRSIIPKQLHSCTMYFGLGIGLMGAAAVWCIGRHFCFDCHRFH